MENFYDPRRVVFWRNAEYLIRKISAAVSLSRDIKRKSKALSNVRHATFITKLKFDFDEYLRM
jgi:hypothetical protein